MIPMRPQGSTSRRGSVFICLWLVVQLLRVLVSEPPAAGGATCRALCVRALGRRA
jgi:hypothetical protein